jgi:UDP-N-acetylmuramate-alanine ligase
VAGREDKKSKKNVSSAKLAKAVNNPKVVSIEKFEDIKKHIKKNCKKGEVVVIMGAGNIYNLFLDLTKK